jgi:hypothetical protein
MKREMPVTIVACSHKKTQGNTLVRPCELPYLERPAKWYGQRTAKLDGGSGLVTGIRI